LELKLVADVALVGFPNAGKSTLISRISAARPKVADYPFTTLEPHLGVVRSGRGEDETEIVVADVPGLIEGAAEGRGLGHRFLRHVERARVLVLLVDMSPEAVSPPAEQERVLLEELRRYRAELSARPRLVVGSRADLATDPASGATDESSWRPALTISAVTGMGISQFVGHVVRMVEESRVAEAGAQMSGSEIVVHRPAPEGIEVEKLADGSFAVSGRPALRAVALNDLTLDEAIAEVQTRLRRLGVERLLARVGARDGDQVHVGDVSFTYHPDEMMEEKSPARRRRSEKSAHG
jgi:GTP-binding protein